MYQHVCRFEKEKGAAKHICILLLWLVLVLVTITTFVTAFYVFGFYLRKYIYRKIKVIYKSIHSLKMPKDQKQKIKDFDFDRIETNFTRSEYEREYEINDAKS